METLNLQEQTKKIWQEEAAQELRNSTRTALVKEMLYQMTRVFLSPWIRARGGLVNLSEVAERTERISEEPEIVSKAIMFLEHVYGFTDHPFTDCLVEAEHGLYCPDHYTAKAFQIICQRAESYFYSQNIVYRFEELTSFLAKEFGTLWEGFPEILGEMSLKRSRRFRVRKGECGELVVYCNASCRRTQASHAPQA